MHMKKIYLLALITLVLGSCSKWLDVVPNTEISTDDFFEDENGFKSALTGIYVRMAKDETYGRNLSFLFLEKLVQRYDGNTPESAISERIYDYKNSSKGTINGIWSGMYRNIANINNLLEHLDIEGTAVLKTPGYYNLIKGEALGLRAFHYFDLLRMWGPIYKDDPTVLAVPFRTTFVTEKTPNMEADLLCAKIVDDLLQASEYLKDDAATWGDNPYDPFLGNRGHRMNKWAVKALLARVYLYQGGASLPKAAELATEVINHSGRELVENNQSDVSFFGETLFGLHMYDMTNRVQPYFSSAAGQLGSELWIKASNGEEVFEGTSIGLNDIRYRNGYGFIANAAYGLMSRKYLNGPSFQLNDKLPLIRLSEMYFIAAEAKKDASFINKVRNARGISRNYNVSFGPDENDNVNLLMKEYQKEFFAEGQFFYFLKRHGLKSFYRCPQTLISSGGMSKIQYVFPLPDDEIEYGG